MSRTFYRLFFVFLLLLSGASAFSQLCTGSLGDPVVNITFGAGSNPGPSLNTTLTKYRFVTNDCPDDGSYTIRNNSSGCFGSSWYTLSADHTGNPNGYFMLVNASYDPSDFYVEKVNGLCANTTYEFAAWILNILKNPFGIKPNLTLTIEDPGGRVLQTYNTGDISVSPSPEWKQYGFFFTTPANISSVVVRIRNNAPGGNGNDLCLDDITFRPCGPKVTAAISGTAGEEVSVCEGNPVVTNLAGEVSEGYINPAFQWQLSTNEGASWQDISGANNKTLQVSPAAKGNYSYRLAVAENGNLGISTCRVSSNIITIHVRELPSLRFQSLAPVCDDQPVTLKADIAFHSPRAWTYQWTSPTAGSGGTSDLQADESTFTGVSTFALAATTLADSGMYRLRIENAYGCIALDSIRLTVKPRPQVSFTHDALTCETTPLGFNGTASIIGGNTIDRYGWDFGNGTVSDQLQPTTRYDTAGNYTVRFGATGSTGCTSDTALETIPVHVLPQPAFDMPEVCLADPYAAFTNSSTIRDNTGLQLSYAWNFGDPLANSANPNVSTAANPQHRYGAVGNYPVRLTATSSKGCIKDTVQNFTVNGSVPKSVFQPDPLMLRCSADSVMVTNRSTVDFGNITRIEIYWDYDRDPLNKTIDEEPLPGKRYGRQYAQVPLAGADYRLRFVVYSGISCVSESEQMVHISRSPEVVFDPLDPTCEEAASITLQQARELTGLPGTGQYSGDGVEGSALFTPKAAGPGEHIIQYRFTSAEGCSAEAYQPITVHPTPIVDAGPDRTLIKGGRIELDARAEGEALNLNWSPPVAISDAAALKPTVFPEVETLYTLLARSSFGCSAQDDVLIKVVDYIAIPNAFTPNGDGKNDTWRIPYIESLPEFDLQLFNRYGQLIYQAKNKLVNWDGTLQGRLQDAGTYVYLLRLKSGEVRRGTLQLIR